MALFSSWVVALGWLGGMLAGAGLAAWWLRSRQPAELVSPDVWPLAARSLMSSEDHEVLQWLKDAFHDHTVTLKVSVLRFTVPTDRKNEVEARRWQELLNGVYCTFTVCTAQGLVVGCVDVPGKRGLSQIKRTMKEKLLSDCGIAYVVVTAADLPASAVMRAAFLGEVAEELPQAEPTQGGDSNFHADLASFNRRAKRQAKDAALARLNSKPAL